MRLLSAPAVPGAAAKPWGIPAILAGLALPLALWGSSLGIAVAEDGSAELSSGEVITSLVLTIIILDGLFLAVPALFSLGRYRLGWAGLGFRPFDVDKLRMAVVAAGGAYVAIIVYGAALALIFGEGAVPEQDVEGLFDSRAVLPVVGVAVVLAAPVAEEVFFRGFVFPGLIRYIGIAGAIFASGLLFAIFHVTGSESAGLVIPFTPIGMLFAWLYYHTGTIWTSIAAHFMFNLVSFIILASTAAIAA